MVQKQIARLLRSAAFRLDPPKSKHVPEFRSAHSIFEDLDPEFKPLYNQCIDYTMTGVERLYALYMAINYIVAADIPGSIVECGVWRGGSSMMCALRLKALGVINRKLYLYDTYAGMSEPSETDINIDGMIASEKWQKNVDGDRNLWDYAPLEDVQKNMRSTHYPEDQIRYIKGKVEDTIVPSTAPEQIALLRLDTDWYESTYHEMVNLYPRLQAGGVLIIDDYGHWRGARRAVDQYMNENKLALYLHRIDYTGRLALVLPNST